MSTTKRFAGAGHVAGDAEEVSSIADAFEIGEDDVGVGIVGEELEEVGFVEVGGVAE